MAMSGCRAGSGTPRRPPHSTVRCSAVDRRLLRAATVDSCSPSTTCPALAFWHPIQGTSRLRHGPVTTAAALAQAGPSTPVRKSGLRASPHLRPARLSRRRRPRCREPEDRRATMLSIGDPGHSAGHIARAQRTGPDTAPRDRLPSAVPFPRGHERSTRHDRPRHGRVRLRFAGAVRRAARSVTVSRTITRTDVAGEPRAPRPTVSSSAVALPTLSENPEE
jgi:hypothetical protein